MDKKQLSKTVFPENFDWEWCVNLFTFYDVCSVPELLIAMDRHISKLQDKVKPIKDNSPRSYREG